MIELPVRDPCDLCEGMAGREERWAIIEAGGHTLTVVNPMRFEVGQCCVITRRHVATLLDLSREECAAVLVAAQRVADALVRAYDPLASRLAETAARIRSNLPSGPPFRPR